MSSETYLVQLVSPEHVWMIITYFRMHESKKKKKKHSQIESLIGITFSHFICLNVLATA